MQIPATCYSDDQVIETRFDATPFFAQASLEEVRALDDIGWGGDYPADDVARFMATVDPEPQRVFTYLALNPRPWGGDPVGFECHVDEDAARRWLQIHRPALLEQLDRTDARADEIGATAEGTGG